jgi:hypothetical protein
VVSSIRPAHCDRCLRVFPIVAFVAFLAFSAGCGGGHSGGNPEHGAALSIVSTSGATFAVGVAAAFAVTATGSPVPSLRVSGSLPAGVAFSDNGNGTGALAGTPGPGTQGSYPLTITAHNGVAADFEQRFTLTVSPAVTGGILYPLKRSANGRYLVDQNNTPVLILGDSPHPLLALLDAAGMEMYMADRQAHGFNAILVQVLCNQSTGGNPSGTTFDGVAPFTSGSSPANYDFSAPNPVYFERLDSLVSAAAAHGLTVFLDPVDTSGWMNALENNGEGKAFNYGAFLGNRYKHSLNIVWQSGNDFQDWNTNAARNNLAFQVMKGIASVDPNHLQTIELNYNGSHSSQDTLLSPVLSLNASYTYFETYDMDLLAYNSTPTLPVFLTEGNYEYENNNHSLPAPTGVFVLREQAYWTMTSGGAGQLYGNHYTWTFPSNWQTFLDSPGVLEIPHWTKLCNAVSWWTLVPDQSHQIVTAGYGTYNAGNLNLTTATYATTAWNPDGSVAVVYDVAGSALTIDLAKFRQHVYAEWYDPSDGLFDTVSGSPFPNSGSMQLTPPGQNHDGDKDWVLVLAINQVSAEARTAEPRRSSAGKPRLSAHK